MFKAFVIAFFHIFTLMHSALELSVSLYQSNQFSPIFVRKRVLIIHTWVNSNYLFDTALDMQSHTGHSKHKLKQNMYRYPFSDCCTTMRCIRCRTSSTRGWSGYLLSDMQESWMNNAKTQMITTNTDWNKERKRGRDGGKEGKRARHKISFR